MTQEGYYQVDLEAYTEPNLVIGTNGTLIRKTMNLILYGVPSESSVVDTFTGVNKELRDKALELIESGEVTKEELLEAAEEYGYIPEYEESEDEDPEILEEEPEPEETEDYGI